MKVQDRRNRHGRNVRNSINKRNERNQIPVQTARICTIL